MTDTMEQSNTDTVMIIVGPDGDRLELDRDIIQRNQYFDAAFNSGFMESERKELNLPSDDPMLFQGIVDHMYGVSMADDVDAHSWLELFKMYVLADKYMQWTYCQELKEFMEEKHRDAVPQHSFCYGVQKGFANVDPSTITALYELTVSESDLRKFAVRLFADAAHIDTFCDRLSEYPPTFCADLLKLRHQGDIVFGKASLDICDDSIHHNYYCYNPTCPDNQDGALAIAGVRFRCTTCGMVSLPLNSSSHCLSVLYIIISSFEQPLCNVLDMNYRREMVNRLRAIANL